MRLSTRLTIAMVALVLLTATAVGLFIHQNIKERALPRALDRIATRAHLLTLELDMSVRSASTDVRTQGGSVNGLVLASIAGEHLLDGRSDAEWRRRVAARFAAELAAKPTYSQYRLIGIADGGREIVRADRMGPGGAIRIVPEDKLQREGDQDYFKASVTLRAGEVYASPIDFNQENGVVETPYVPTVRIAAPVLAPDGKAFGIMIVNVDLRSAFAELRTAAREGGNIYVINELGDFLVHADPSQEFGFEFGRPIRLQDEFPELARGLQQDNTRSRIVQDRTGARFGFGWDAVRLAGGPQVTIIESVPYARVLAANTGTPSVLGALVAVLGAIPLAILLARSLSRPLAQVTRAIERFARDESIAIPTTAKGEIGLLARAFARMADDVREKTAALKREVERQKKAQEAMLESEQMARRVIDYALDAFIQINEAGELTEWNPRAEAIFGWSREEVIGKPPTSLFIPTGCRPRYLDLFARLRTGEDVSAGQRFEVEAVRKDGQAIKVEVSLTGLRHHGGYVVTGFIRDLTEKIAAEEQLRQSQKMEAVGQLTGGIAHDFNNMLTVITGTIEILGEAVADKPQLAEIAKLISEAADRGAELTNQLLAFARKQPLQPRKIDINSLMVESGKLLRPALGEQIEIEMKMDENVSPVLADPTQLTTAIVNLAVNARDAMPNGGKLTLEVQNVTLDQTYAAINREVQPGNYVMIAVSDTGTGIPEAIREKIFEPFFSTKGSGKGTGLGLSMVYGFVKQSGGHIKLYSEEGHGTTIRIYLPQTDDQSEHRVDGTPTDALQGGNETILLVEDDAMVRTSVVNQLRSLGYKTISATNAAEALAVVDHGAAFDLLFTDVIMSGVMNGRQLADEVAKRRPGTRVLFTSGYTENAIVHHGRLDRGVLLLTKPYRKSDLARMIRTALDAESCADQPNVKVRRRAAK